MSTPTSASAAADGPNSSVNGHGNGQDAPSTPPSTTGSGGSKRSSNGGPNAGAFGLLGEPMTPSPVAASITPIPRDHAKGVDPEVWGV